MLRPISDVLASTLNEITQRQEAGGVDIVGLPTGFRQLDSALGGLRKDALYILGGATSMGKTALALTIAQHVAKNHHVLFVSLEMSSELLLLRLLSGISGIPALSIEMGRMQDAEFKHLLEQSKQLNEYKMQLYDASLTTETLGEVMRNAGNIELLVVDYLSLLRNTLGTTLHERVSYIVGDLREMARSFDIPVLALVQLNREVDRREGNLPTLSDIRLSGEIEHDAHAVLFAFRQQYYLNLKGQGTEGDEHDAKIIIAKNRQGPTGMFTCSFYPKRMVWEDRKEQTPPRIKAVLNEQS